MWIFLYFWIVLLPISSLDAKTMQSLLGKEKVQNAIEATVQKNFKWNFTIISIFQDEAPYLREWIEFHQLVGAEHFILYNNQSTDSYQEVLKPYIENGLVELVEWNYSSANLDDFMRIQLIAYRDAIQRMRGKSKWIAVIDIDEFLVPTTHNKVTDLLSAFEHDRSLGGLLIYWCVFGTSYVPAIPENKLMIEVLLLNGGVNRQHYKSIIRPDRTVEMASSHSPVLFPGYITHHLDYDLIRINHYWSRDEWFLKSVKIPRRLFWGTSIETCKHWATAQNHATSQGDIILRYIPEMRRRLGLDNE